MTIRWFQPKTLMATIGAVILPLLALAYLASMPGMDSAFWVLLKGAIVVLGVVLFGLMLARLLEQVKAARVGRWLETDEGSEWIESLPEDERQAFKKKFEEFE
jgi:uncharacterized membrane protein